MTFWLKLIVSVLAVTAMGMVIAAWFASARWNEVTEDTVARLRRSGPPHLVAAYAESELAGVPAPVARYFRRVLHDGQPVVTRARVMWAGEFNTGSPGRDRWAGFTAVQEFVPGAPGMVWDARIAMMPGIPVHVRHAFVDGAGSMHGAVLGLFTVVDSGGTPGMATASLQRYLAEATWFPTALLPSQGVRWTAIDDTRALAALRAGAATASVEFRFAPTGLVASVFVPDRLYDDGKSPPMPRPWQGRNLSYVEREGITVPGDAIVEWLMPTGPYAYWRAHPTALAFEYAR